MTVPVAGPSTSPTTLATETGNVTTIARSLARPPTEVMVKIEPLEPTAAAQPELQGHGHPGPSARMGVAHSRSRSQLRMTRIW